MSEKKTYRFLYRGNDKTCRTEIEAINRETAIVEFETMYPD